MNFFGQIKKLIIIILLLLGVLVAQTADASDLLLIDNANSDHNQDYQIEPIQQRRKILYFDAGMSYNTTRLNYGYAVSNDGFDGKEVRYSNKYSINNFNARLGLRLNKKFILITDFQTIGIREDIYYNFELMIWGNPLVIPIEINVGPISYFGGGFILYPYERFQFGATIGEAKSPFTMHEGEIISNNPDILGFGYNLSLAYDVPIKKIGLLVGCNFFQAPSKIDYMITTPTSYISSIGLFTKIRY